MKIICIRHVAFEGPGIISNWAKEKGFNFQVIKPYEEDSFPSIDSIDALVVMGGPMGANDEIKYPWLTDEKELIHEALFKQIPIIGICLGSQLLANVLGSPVYRNPEKEIGWFPVELTPDGRNHKLTKHLPEMFTTFHWHGDTYDLPQESIHLARTAACVNQAFVYQNALGLQFHMEMTEDGIEEVAERCSQEFITAPCIQPREEIYHHPAMAFNHKALREILDVWIVPSLTR